MNEEPATITPPNIPRRSHIPNSLRRAIAVLAIAGVGTGAASQQVGAAEKLPVEPGLAQLGPEQADSSGRIAIAEPEATSASETAVSAQSSTGTRPGYTMVYDQAKKPHEHHKPHHKPQKHHPKPKEHHHKHKKHPHKPTTVTPPVVPAPPLQDLHPENLPGDLTPEVVSVMKENAAYILPSECSGWLLRNSDGVAVGVLSAKHCGFLPSDGNLSTDANGQPVYNFNQPLTVYNGNEVGNATTPSDMTEVGVVNNVYVDPTTDMVVLSFAGQDPEAVVALAQSQVMPASQSSTLPEGSVVFSRGITQYQPNNTGPEEMQNFAMSVLGNSNWAVTNPGGQTIEQVNLLIAAVPLSPDGAECSPGESGAGYIVYNSTNNQWQVVGIATAYNDWGRYYTANNPTQAAANLAYFQSEFNASLSGYFAVCGVEQQFPSAATGGQFIPVNNPEDPSFAIDSLVEQYRDDMFEAGYTPQVIKGLVDLGNKGWLENPTFEYDPTTDTLLLGGYTQNSDTDPADHLGVTVIQNASRNLQDLSVYSDDGKTAPSLTTATGTLELDPDQLSFEDQNGLAIGQSNFPIEPLPASAGATLSIDSSGQVLMTQPSGDIVPVANLNPGG